MIQFEVMPFVSRAPRMAIAIPISPTVTPRRAVVGRESHLSARMKQPAAMMYVYC